MQVPSVHGIESNESEVFQMLERIAMKHDLEDIIEMVRCLEQRIIHLERAVESITSPITEDRWYWLH